MNDISDFLSGPVLSIGGTVLGLGITVFVYFTVIRPMNKDVSQTLASVRADVAQAQGMLAGAANLRMTGLPSQARVLGIQPTGTMINMAPECRVDLEVYPPMAAAGYRVQPYRVAIMQALHQVVLPRVQPGMTVPVKIEAANPLNVVVDV
jgi:hypothetical protein